MAGNAEARAVNDAVDLDEASLAARAVAGDHEAFGQLVEHYQGRFRVMVARYVASTDDAADIVQDGFIEAWRALAGFDHSRPIGPWLRAICRHRMIKHLRERSRLPASPLAAIDGRFVDFAEQHSATDQDGDLRLHAMRMCMKKLSPRHRAVLVARFQEGAAVQDIAAQEGSSPNAVSMLLLRIKDALVRCVGTRLAQGVVQ